MNGSILSVVPEQNETEKHYCIIHIFLNAAHSNKKTNITIVVMHTVRFPQCNTYVSVYMCVYVYVFVCVFVCEIYRISGGKKCSNQKLAPSKGEILHHVKRNF